MEAPLLKDPETPPSADVLKGVLKNSFLAYEKLLGTMTGPGHDLDPGWNYYKDGKAWLCKVCYKKKTVFWLSVWDGYFKAGFYFTAKNSSGVTDLAIDKNIKDEFINRKPIGKLLPLTMNISRIEQLDDLLKIIEYKKRLK